jgi:hypothetical protein
VLVALTVLLAKACQRFWSKATAAPGMLTLLSGDVQWCSRTYSAARCGLAAFLIEGYCRSSDARPPVWRRATVLVALIALLAVARQPFWSKATAAPVMLVLLFGGAQWCS